VSDTILRLHAADPEFRADEPTAARARLAAKSLFPEADEIDVEVYEHVTLIDCGENLERILCPHCGATISVEWWTEWLDEFGPAGLELADVDASTPSPCCGKPVTLRSLIYDWPMGFARFTVDIWNPNPWPEGDDAATPAMVVGESIGVTLRSPATVHGNWPKGRFRRERLHLFVCLPTNQQTPSAPCAPAEAGNRFSSG
jgi:hypothetical protein